MNFEFNHKEKFSKLKTSILVSIITEDFLNSTKCSCGKKCMGALEQAEEFYDFKAEKGEICITAESRGGIDKTIIFAGLGKEKDLNENSFQDVGAKILDYAKSHKIKSLSVGLNLKLCCDNALTYTNKVDEYKVSEMLANVAFGIALKSYTFNKYYTGKKLEKKLSPLKDVELLCKDTKIAEAKYAELDKIKENVFFCRDLVNEPANVLNPESYADICRELMKLGVGVEVFGDEKMAEMGMYSLLGVGQGSDYESQLVIMKWNGSKDKKEKPIAFVGKGITFDSGGLSIKSGRGMEDMKIDMTGSAVVVSLMRLLAMRKAKVNAIGVVALVENMPSGKAQRPGDIVKSLSGQTIEVLNTDAEGRLILADALYYTVNEFKPKTVIDLATLTGAIMIALEETNAGLFSNNDRLVKELEDAAEKTGENVWRMPLSKLGEGYDKLIDSDIADMRNIGLDRYGGSITAAQFLHRFIDKHTKWAHIDIAGTACVKRPKFFVKKGATGYGVRLLNELVRDEYEDK